MAKRSLNKKAEILEDHFGDIGDKNWAVFVILFFHFQYHGEKSKFSFQVEVIVDFKNPVGEGDLKKIESSDLLEVVMRWFQEGYENVFEHFSFFLIKSTVKQPHFFNHDGGADDPVVLDVKFGFVSGKYVNNDEVVNW